MARRRTLAEQADRLASAILGDLDQVPASVAREITRLESDLGLTRPFASYSRRTRRRYLAAARKGRTAREQREAESAQRKQRTEQRKGRGIESDPRWREIIEKRNEMWDLGLNTTAGPDTQMDELEFEDLITDESLRAHVMAHGFAFVQRRIDGQLLAIREYAWSFGARRDIGRERMRKKFGTIVQRDIKGAGKDEEDERWFWYHTRHP